MMNQLKVRLILSSRLKFQKNKLKDMIFFNKVILLATLLFVLTDLKAQNNQEYICMEYEYNSARLASKEDVKIFGYFKLFPDGKVELINKNGSRRSIHIDKRFFLKLDSVTLVGLDHFRNKIPPKPNSFFAGQYSFLTNGIETLCFSDVEVKKELSQILKEIRMAIKEKKGVYQIGGIVISNELINQIKSTHSISNLLPIASPPPMMPGSR